MLKFHTNNKKNNELSIKNIQIKNSKEPISLYLIINSDLNMSEGKIISQIVHSTVKVCIYSLLNKSLKVLFNKWVIQGERVIILKSGLENMKILSEKFTKLKIFNIFITDAGKTEVKANSITILVVGPNFTNNIYSEIKDLNIY